MGYRNFGIGYQNSVGPTLQLQFARLLLLFNIIYIVSSKKMRRRKAGIFDGLIPSLALA